MSADEKMDRDALGAALVACELAIDAIALALNEQWGADMSEGVADGVAKSRAAIELAWRAFAGESSPEAIRRAQVYARAYAQGIVRAMDGGAARGQCAWRSFIGAECVRAAGHAGLHEVAGGATFE